MNGSTSRSAHIVLTNETEGHMFAEFDEPLADDLTSGMLYRIYQAEYGRCKSKVYIDTADGVLTVGWYFEKRDRYEDSYYERGDLYLRGAWVTICPAAPAGGSTSLKQGESA